MLKYIFKRILASLVTIWVVVTLTFFLVRLMPGGPFDGEKITPEIKANLEQKYGLDKPLSEQYGMFMKNLLKGDLGTSMVFKGREVKDTITTSLPASAKVGIVTVACSLTLGVLFGIVAALKSGKWPDKVCMIFATLGITIPSFVIGAVLIYIFAVNLRVLPASGLKGPETYIMPVIALSGSSLAFITRLTRSRMLEVLKADYIRTAKAKGLSRSTVIFKHGLRNSLIPIVTYIGPLIAGILTGSFIVEKVFAIPGLGNEFVSSVNSRDYSTVLGLVVFYSTLIIVCNLIVDILYVIIDPRIKLEN
ncbi:MAG: ABC transporter permease [Clostridium sp.]